MALKNRLYYLLALPLLLRLIKARLPPSREALLLPSDERVILLGASSGIGRDLAHAYARRGAQICLVARRGEALEKVKQECLELGLDPARVFCIAADVTSSSDLIRVRRRVQGEWSGFDTLHILAGVPSTSTLYDLAGTPLVSSPKPGEPSRRVFHNDKGSATLLPDEVGLERVAAEARICAEVNYLGTVLALAAFLPLLASTSKSPAVHHLSSVAAAIPAPRRAIYSATKAAGFMAFESCRVECEGSGVRFFSLLPGTIENDFRRKSALGGTGGKDELDEGIKHNWEGLLLQPERVVHAILTNLARPPSPAPLIPYPPFSWIPALTLAPPSSVLLPWQYFMAVVLRLTPTGKRYVDRGARKKYGLPP